MSKEWDNILKAQKKLQPQIKKFDSSIAEKQIKKIKLALETAWDAEDVLAAALKKAKEAGLKGKKPADFMADAEFKAALGKLKKEAAQHAKDVKILDAFSKQATPTFKELTKLLATVNKLINEKDKEQVKVQDALTAGHEKVKFSAQSKGKLTPAEIFYGAQLDRVVDRVINKSKDAGKSGPAGDAAKLIELKELTKNSKATKKMATQIEKLCVNAVNKAETNKKAAVQYLKKASELHKKQKEFNTAYLAVKKKNADLIKKSKDKSKILRGIAAILSLHKQSSDLYSAALDEVKELAP
ncbi:hypothetical protein EBB79_12640 [Parasedimentitalea marina]|uniref:Uncharacterized protein n=1 Tax=Parasedimentitalea marina TaxID=2483033 RepID=A0A3T0N3S1_9RHOB|nr:hypothetical protein [Parasedimentitalea marina]AZV78637.1 hypothetical protein EBB79_12640 [Parasedimentitalea marina]